MENEQTSHKEKGTQQSELLKDQAQTSCSLKQWVKDHFVESDPWWEEASIK